MARHMRARTIGVVVLCFVFFSVAPSPASASDCASYATSTTGTGYFFSSYEDVQYSPQGYVEEHFRLLPSFADGRTFDFFWTFHDDECVMSDGSFSPTHYPITLPPGVTDWSARMTSQTHIEVWDDQNNVIISSFDIPTYPSYEQIIFYGSISGGASSLESGIQKIYQNGAVPAFENKISKAAGCPDVQAGGYLYDSYQKAEYVDGLLRVHLRLKGPYNDGRMFNSIALPADHDCNLLSPAPNPIFGTIITPYIRYFSFRMASSTHWALWNDENDVQIICPNCEGDIPADTPDVAYSATVDGGASYLITTPFPPTEPQVGCVTNCFSNVLFLPGIESSRLYRPDGSGGDKQIWEPQINHDNTQLAMTSAGQSIEPDIYTKDALDSALGIDVYGSFETSMRNLAKNNDFQFDVFPYDWRYSADYIATHPTQLATTSASLIDSVKRLAATSKSGKVTIIAHSNGGLVAKELMLALGADGSKYIDKLIFVAVPQIGTPQAIAGLLHGYNEALPVSWAPLLISAAESRSLGSNMPGAFGLLPSPAYFNSVSTPVISFSTTTLASWAAKYGQTINSPNALTSFLTDSAARTQPVDSDLDDPYLLSSILLSQSQAMHTNIDAWTPPVGVQLIQIAGWGVPSTVSGIGYKQVGGSIKEDTTFTIDGDGTVVVPSALWTSGSSSTQRYWLDLERFSNDHWLSTLGGSSGFLAFDHATILSTQIAQTFIADILTEDLKPLSDYKYLSTIAPQSIETRLLFSLHSPLTLSMYDSQGRHTGVSTTTGEIEENIPGTYYTQLGDVKYIFSDAGSPEHILMNGYASGTFTLNIDQYQGDVNTGGATFSNVPTTPQTVVKLDMQSDASTLSPLAIDQNGDGTSDTYVAQDNGSLSLDQLITNLMTATQNLSITSKLKTQLLNKISAIQKKIDKQKQKQSTVLVRLQAQLQKKADKGKIDAAATAQLSSLLDDLIAQSATIPLDPDLLGQLANQINALSSAQPAKNALLTKVAQLQNLTSINRSLSGFTQVIAKKAAKGLIPDADVQNILNQLDQIQAVL